MLVVLPDGTEVLAHGRLDVIPAERPRDPDIAVYLDSRWATDSSVMWPFTLIEWKDFEVPSDETTLFRTLVAVRDDARSGRLVEIACDGGTGRTGTALACLAVLAGLDPPEAVAWVRRNYHPWAVEVPEQELLVQRFREWSATGREQ
jgi:hypothetical protein